MGIRRSMKTMSNYQKINIIVICITISLLPNTLAAPTSGIGRHPWGNQVMPQEINSETTENKMNNEEQEMYRAAETLSLQEQDLLHELMKMMSKSKGNDEAELLEGVMGNKDVAKYGISAPYYMKDEITAPKSNEHMDTPYYMKRANRGVSTPYFMKRSNNGFFIPYYMKRSGVSAPYFMKRSGVSTPYFMKKGLSLPYFMKREEFGHLENQEVEQDAVSKTSENENKDVEANKRIFGHMSSLDLDNYLALQGAAKEYNRQLWNNEQRMQLEGK